MACQTCGTKNKKCGCKDSAYTTVKTYTCPEDDSCPSPSPCSEYVDSRCTFYNGTGIWELGISERRSLQSIIQQMIIRTGSDPECADPCSPCQSTWNVYSSSKGSNNIVLNWDASATAVTYQVEYQVLPEDGCTLGSWTLLAGQTTTFVNITSLTADTTYLLRVNSICASGNCYSVTVTIKTEA